MPAQDSHGIASFVAVALFALVWLGLATNIRKIAGRAMNPPSFSRVLNAAHVGRFGGWALLGAATLRGDPWTGGMLLATRLPAVALVLVTFVQRRSLRPSARELLRLALAPVAVLAAICLGLALLPANGAAVPALQAFVAACFAVQIVYALPRQIGQAREQPLGNLRWFQMALLANYGFMLAYSIFVRDAGVQTLMRAAYGAVFVEQAVLVALIERGVRRRRSGP